MIKHLALGSLVLLSGPLLAGCGVSGHLSATPTGNGKYNVSGTVHTSGVPTSSRMRKAPTHAQHTTMPFRPNRTESAATGTPNGWGQMLWPTTTVAWAWMQPPEQGGVLAHTTNGGQTWSEWRTPDTSWLQLAAQGSQTAWILGEESSGSNTIWLHTSNGGATWTRWVMQLPPGAKGAGNHVTAVFPHPGFDAMGLLEDGQFWWSHVGEPWETMWSQADHVTTVASIPGGGEAISLKTATDETILRRITVGSTGRVSTDSAESMPGSVIGMDWLTSRNGWIWSTSRVWKTTNGGRSWTALDPMPGDPQESPATLYMTSPTRGYAAVGQTNGGPLWDTSQLWSTTNGGRTWSRVTLPTITYHLPNATLPLDGFYVSAVTAHTLTLWYGPVTQQGVPQRIWTNNQGKTWHRADPD